MHTHREYMSWLGNLYNQNYTMLLRIARKHLGYSPDKLAEAEDVVQDVFVLAAGKNLQAEAKPVGWLIVTTENLCKNRYKRYLSNAAKEKMLADRLLVDQSSRYTGLAESAQDDEAEAVSLNVTLQQELTEEEYRLFNEYYQDGQKVETISERAGTTPGAIRARLHRLKSKISKISFVAAVLFLLTQYM